MIWIIINGSLSITAAAVLTYKLARFPENFTAMERLGMGVLGAALVMNIAPIVRTGTPFNCAMETPFDDWGSTLMRVGIALYFIGRLLRNMHPRRNNGAMIATGRLARRRRGPAEK